MWPKLCELVLIFYTTSVVSTWCGPKAQRKHRTGPCLVDLCLDLDSYTDLESSLSLRLNVSSRYGPNTLWYLSPPTSPRIFQNHLLLACGETDWLWNVKDIKSFCFLSLLNTKKELKCCFCKTVSSCQGKYRWPWAQDLISSFGSWISPLCLNQQINQSMPFAKTVKAAISRWKWTCECSFASWSENRVSLPSLEALWKALLGARALDL